MDSNLIFAACSVTFTPRERDSISYYGRSGRFRRGTFRSLVQKKVLEIALPTVYPQCLKDISGAVERAKCHTLQFDTKQLFRQWGMLGILKCAFSIGPYAGRIHVCIYEFKSNGGMDGRLELKQHYSYSPRKK